MDITPVGELVLARNLEFKQPKHSIIVQTFGHDKMMFKAVVEKVGPGRETEDGTIIPTTVKPGDLIWFDRNAQTPVRINDAEYIITKDSDIFAIIEEDDTY